MFPTQLRSWLARVGAHLVIIAFAAAAAPPAPAQTEGVDGAKINWLKYMQQARTASAIAMALSYVDDCSKKLEIQEYELKDQESGADVLVLSFSCQGGEDEEGSAILTFWGGRRAFEDGTQILKGFDFAG